VVVVVCVGEGWVGGVVQLRKKRLALGAEQFNRSPKKGLEFLQGIGLLPEPLDAAAVAGFFRTAPGLDRTAVGTYLGEPDQFNLDVGLRPITPLSLPLSSSF
jgi:Sec7-like guanine-nucleotide exchange factor